ncbi:conserved hypothetical protein [Ixodes scapularis]|uniref:UDP-N-acetylglucosamine transferase subunit ALG14 n=1 Tax=Ixodes scapularis TaxID=6945 RepID=B7Q3Z4_IXOSC|nr:conserved hypothetical protein [Ixodes scapularis]|eukprot:XP_002411423.1 conserved hypothetical protein [Ixodes scapularis]
MSADKAKQLEMWRVASSSQALLLRFLSSKKDDSDSPEVLGIKKASVVYVESFCRVETLSITGRVLYHLADHFVVQWPQLSAKYPRAKYHGLLV